MLDHEHRIAGLARELAAAHGVDPDRAELVGFLHDIADHYSDQELLASAGYYGISVSPVEAQVPRLLHAPVGAAILRQDYGILDDELLDAVRQHVTGAPHMGPLAKVLFVADKLDPAGESVMPAYGVVRRLAAENLDRALLAICDVSILHQLDHIQPLDERLVATRNFVLERTGPGTLNL